MKQHTINGTVEFFNDDCLETTKCIFCLAPAVVHTGHVCTKKGKRILAGWCENHGGNRRLQNAALVKNAGHEGCFGKFEMFMGFRKSANDNDWTL